MKTNALCMAFLALFFFNCKNAGSSKSSDDAHQDLASDPFNELLGEFSSEIGGRAEFRISNANGNFFVETWEKGEWSDEEQIVLANNETLASLFGENMVQHIKAGLMSKEAMFGIFKVDDGFELAGDKVDTDYIAIFLFPLKVYKL